MIKAKDFGSGSSKIDALAQVLGYRFEGGTYVKIGKITVTRRQNRNGISTRPMFVAIHNSILSLGIGQDIDITNSLKTVGFTVARSRKLLRSWCWYAKKMGRGSYKIDNFGKRTVARRIG